MTKVLGPLFSIQAHGMLSGTICYRRGRHGGTVLVPRSPNQPHTASQLAQRAEFTSAVSSWRNSPSASRVWWNAKAIGMATGGYNLYVKNYLLGLSRGSEPPGPEPGDYDWFSPTGSEDLNDRWDDDTNGYDGNTVTYAESNTWAAGYYTEPLIFTFDSKYCGAVKLWISNIAADSLVRVDGYGSWSWHAIYEGVAKRDPYGWQEMEFSKRDTNKVRVSIKPSTDLAPRINEVEVGEVIQ